MTSKRTDRSSDGTAVTVLADLSEDEILDLIVPTLPSGAHVVIGPGDDTALLSTRSGAVLATTDSMIRERDWLDEWSSAQDVGRKVVAQNAADIAAMGGMTTGLLVSLVADPQTPVDWVVGLHEGVGAAAREAGIAVLGGDLSSAPAGTLMVSVTALGELSGEPVLRSGARVGDQVAVVGSLGRSAAGLLLLQRNTPEAAEDLVTYHRRPRAPYEQGPTAAGAGATAMLDLSDGLVRDALRIAKASGVRLAIETDLLAADVDSLAEAIGHREALKAVLTGGEEHSLLACFPAAAALPSLWRRIGQVVDGRGVTVDSQPMSGGGWDHFATTEKPSTAAGQDGDREE